MSLINSTHSILLYNTCMHNRDGISLSRPKDTTAKDNRLFFNHLDGIKIYGAGNGTVIRNNTCFYNDGAGISISGVNGGNISDNILISNQIGINFRSAQDSRGWYVRRNIILNSEYSGISLYGGDHNYFYENTISGNKYGIYLGSSSRNNTAHHNNIYDNTEYGIEIQNTLYAINATHNWWGDPSGPYHPVENPSGKGDYITSNVNFKPWLEDPYPSEKKEDYVVIHILLMMIAALFFILAYEVHLPDPSMHRMHAPPQGEQFSGKMETLNQSINDPIICSNCGNQLRAKRQDSIRVVCDKCGKDVLNTKFR